MALAAAPYRETNDDASLEVRLRERVIHRGSGATIEVAGELDVASASGFAVATQLALLEPCDVVRVDLDGIAFLDCAGLSALLRLRDALERRTTRVQFVNLSPAAALVFDLSRIPWRRDCARSILP